MCEMREARKVKKIIIAAFLLCLCFLLTGCAGSYIVQEDDIQEVIDKLYENWDQVYSFEDSVYTIEAFLEDDAEYTKDDAEEALGDMLSYYEQLRSDINSATDALYGLVD